MKARSLAWSLVAALAGVLLLARLLPDSLLNTLPGCLFRKYSGFFCVTCGATRAVWFISRGMFALSLSMNILVLPGIVFLLYAAAASLINGYSGSRILPEIKLGLPLFIALIILALAFLILRNIPAFPFNLLAPSCQ